MTYNQLMKQLKTWKRDDRDKYNQIMMLADANGILTEKRRYISKAKKNKSKFDRFVSQYKINFGSYTSYIEEQKERRKKMIEQMERDGVESDKIRNYFGKNVKEFTKNMDRYNDLIDELYETIRPSGDAHSYHMYAETLPNLYSAIDYLQSLLY